MKFFGICTSAKRSLGAIITFCFLNQVKCLCHWWCGNPRFHGFGKVKINVGHVIIWTSIWFYSCFFYLVSFGSTDSRGTSFSGNTTRARRSKGSVQTSNTGLSLGMRKADCVMSLIENEGFFTKYDFNFKMNVHGWKPAVHLLYPLTSHSWPLTNRLTLINAGEWGLRTPKNAGWVLK